MTDDGEIYSIVAVNTYGDYQLASLTRPSWMHEWIKENVDLREIAQFHGDYDPVLKVVVIFVVKYGSAAVDMALLYYPERTPTEAWMIHDNTLAVSGYNASSCCVVPLITGGYGIHTGDYLGNIWELNQASRNDNGAAYYGGFKTPPDSGDDLKTSKHFNSCNIVMEAVGPYPLKIRTWVDGIILPTLSEVDMGGEGAPLDSFMLDTDELGGSDIIDMRFKVGKIGRRIQYELFNDGASEDFYISSYRTDFKTQGNAQ